MGHVEIDSFVSKFKMLWSAGVDASLNFESKPGEVFISLNCKVGRVLPPPAVPLSSVVPKHRSPSYYRRQARRKASRECSSEPPVAEQANEVVDINIMETNSEVTEEAAADYCEDAEDSTDAESEGEYEVQVGGSETRSEEVSQESSGYIDNEASDDLGDQLRSLIQESKKQRERWERLKVSEENG